MAHPACCAVSLSESGHFGGATARQRSLPSAELLSLFLYTRKRSARAAQTSTRGDNQVTCVTARQRSGSRSLNRQARLLSSGADLSYMQAQLTRATYAWRDLR
eukprot:scaffold49593_cov63-Phaeocystis_antarctica.AAC.1